MGMNTTVLVLNDALPGIEKDKDFGNNLAQAIFLYALRTASIQSKMPIDIPAGHFGNAATVIESHHNDLYKLILVGGNTAYDLGYAGFSGKDPRNTKDMKVLLNDLASQYGLKVSQQKAAKHVPD